MVGLAILLLDERPYGSVNPIPRPVVFAPGLVSTAKFESHPHFTKNGKTLYFVQANDQFTYWTIMVCHWQKGAWSKPKVAPFSGKNRDADPFITSDGKRFFFISDRPSTPGETKKDMDVWYMDRKGEGWGEPVCLGPEVNTKGNEWYPTADRRGTLYFCSARKGGLGELDVWCSELVKGKYAEAKNLGAPVNTVGSEVEAFVSDDGKTLIWDGDGPASLGDLDFYASHRTATGWSPPKHLPAPFSSEATELSPKITPDGKYFVFTSDRKGGKGLGDIWIVDLRSLGL